MLSRYTSTESMGSGIKTLMHRLSATARPSITPLQIAVIAAAVSQVLASQFSRLSGVGTPIEDLPQPYVSPEDPESYAFAIWGVIFALALIYSAKQLFPASNDKKLFEATRPASACLFSLSSIWMISAQLWGNGFHLVVIIVTMLIVAIYLLTALSKSGDRTAVQNWIIDPLFGLFAGWLTLATFLNAGSALRDTVGTFGLSPVAFAAAILLPAGLFALVFVVKSRGSWWYSAAVIWGLVAVIATNIGTTASVEVIALSTILILAVSSTTMWVRSQPK